MSFATIAKARLLLPMSTSQRNCKLENDGGFVQADLRHLSNGLSEVIELVSQ
jgi:hypothetical protein